MRFGLQSVNDAIFSVSQSSCSKHKRFQEVGAIMAHAPKHVTKARTEKPEISSQLNERSRLTCAKLVVSTFLH